MLHNPDIIITATIENLPVHPGDTAAILAAIEKAFDALADADYQQGMTSTVPGATRIYGVRVPHLRALGGGMAKHYRVDADGLKALALAIWAEASREHQVLALVMLGKVNMPAREAWEIGASLLPQVDNWETCDQLCAALLDPALMKHPDYMDRLEAWVTHPNFWFRRAALASTTRLQRFKGTPDEAFALDGRVLGMCAALLEDDEPYVMKAVDWAARGVIERHYDLGVAWMMEQAGKGLSRKAQSTLKKAAKKLTAEDEVRLLASLGN